jgi:hypothetical protein
MRLSRPRFTIRLMMVLVAVAALALSVGVTRRRMANLSFTYLARATEYQSKAEVARVSALESEYLSQHGRTPDPKYAQRGIGYRRLSAFYLTMKRKYERAATQPWLPIAPDPAPPAEP